MRISTSQIYGNAVSSIQRNQSQLVRLQNQIAGDRRMLTAADDPVAAARALAISQTKEVASQYAQNQGDATDRLDLVDKQLSAATDLLQTVRARVVQVGNTTLTDADRQTVATELGGYLEELMGIANSRDAEGDYLFSGHQGATPPFARSPAVPPATVSPVAYFGDDGQRALQVSASQQIVTNVTGNDLFMNIPAGNGTFSTAAGRNVANLPNQGSGQIDTGSVVDPAKWQTAWNTSFSWQGTDNRSLQVRFSAPGGVLSYQIFDASSAAPPATPAAPVAVGPVLPFVSGQAISLLTTTQGPAPQVTTDFGAQVVITGSPAVGDTFTIQPGGNKSVFQTVQEVIDLLRVPLSSSTARTGFSSQLQTHLNNMDQALGNFERVQTTVGARLAELDSLSSNAASLDIQYQQTLSNLEGLDYAQAISEFTQQQVSLEAAQKSFVQISGLSLFKYL